jgi:probable HAF family extracellular repeat protein
MLFQTLFRGEPDRSATRPWGSRPPRRGGRSCQPRLEALEERCLLSYSILDIGTFGGSTSVATAIDNFPFRATGYAALPSNGFHAFWYEGGPNRDIGTLGGSESFGYGVNGGRVVGSSDLAGDLVSHAFLWSFPDGMTMTDLGTLGGFNSSARALNDSGQVIGSADLSDGAGTHAFLDVPPYDSTTMLDLGTLGGTTSSATSINTAGKIVGSSSLPDSSTHAFLDVPPYDNTTMSDLGTLPGGTASFAEGINSSDQVVGSSNLSPSFDTHAFLWTSAGGMSDLGTLGGSSSIAYGINALGQVVGNSYTTPDDTVLHAFLSNGTVMQDLNDLLPPGSGWELISANAINDSGQIVGEGIINGQHHAFFMFPDGGSAPRGAPAKQDALPPGPSSPQGVALGAGPELVAALLGKDPISLAPTQVVPLTPNGPPVAPALQILSSPAPRASGAPAPLTSLDGGDGHVPVPTGPARTAPGGVDVLFADPGQDFRPLDGALS